MSDDESGRNRIAEANKRAFDRREKAKQSEAAAKAERQKRDEQEQGRLSKIQHNWDHEIVLNVKGAMHRANARANQASLSCRVGNDEIEDPHDSPFQITIFGKGPMYKPVDRARQPRWELVFKLEPLTGKVRIKSETQRIDKSYDFEEVNRELTERLVEDFMVHVLDSL
jgi:hypothetical protein